MIEEYINFESDGKMLEGVLCYDEDAVNPSMVLLCPPHPHLGGDMDNNVITALGKTLAEKGFAALRFNYRGVGNSGSEYDNVAEKYKYWDGILNNDDYSDALIDAMSALRYLGPSIGADDVFITGYSFGAIVSMMLSLKNESIKAFASISTPFSRFDLKALSDCHIPKLFICADNDFASSIEDVHKGMADISAPKRLEIFKNCDHFYIDNEQTIANMVFEFFSNCSIS